MITSLDNRLCDYWWEDILPYVNKVDWERHYLTPELVKLQLILNRWLVFRSDNCLWMGYFIHNPKKHFFVAFVSGSNLYSEIGKFIEHISDHFACNYLIGLTVPGMIRLYKKLNYFLNYGSISNSGYYEIDLIKYPYDEMISIVPVIWQNPFYINNWIEQIQCDIIPRDFINESVSVYKIGSGYVVGTLTNDLIKKYFNIVYISLDVTQEDMATFFYFVETQMMCRYVNCSDSLNCLFNIDSEGIRKFGLTTFERKIHYDSDKTILPGA